MNVSLTTDRAIGLLLAKAGAIAAAIGNLVGRSARPPMAAGALALKDTSRYVGCRNAALFRREIAAGHWPPALPIDSRPRRCAKEALDR